MRRCRPSSSRLSRTKNKKSGQGLDTFAFHPIYDNYTENKLLAINICCNQVCGLFDGYAVTDEGRVGFHDLLAFVEHAVSR